MKPDLPIEKRFLELLAHNRAKLLKICRVYARQPADQDDLYQEMLSQIWRALPNLKEEAHANTWLYRVALNTAISFVRKHRTHQTRIVQCGPAELSAIPAAQPSHDAEYNEKLSQLFQAIAQLSDTEKAVITLFLEDVSYQEIASVMGMSESNVGVVLHRAKKRLSALMKEAPCTMTP